MTTKFRTIQSKFNQVKRRIPTMSQSGTIVQRKADTYIPNEYLEKVLAANPSGWGAVTLSEVDDHKFLEINSGDEGATVDDIQQTMKMFPKQDITFYFCQSEALNMKDISPYILFCKPCEEDPDEEEPQIVAFIEGNFPTFAKAGSSHPPEYHLAADYLVPKIEGMFEMCDGDLDKVVEQLKKPYFKKELLLTSVSRGSITLVAANGASLTFDQNDLSADYPWGWVSNTHGYASDAKPVDVPKPKKKSMFSKEDNETKEPFRSTVREKAVPSEKIAEAVIPPKTDTAVVLNYTTKKWKPAGHLSRKDRKLAYKGKIGYAPHGWESCIEVDVFYDPQGKLMTFSQVKALGTEAIKVLSLANNPPRDKDLETEHLSPAERSDQEFVNGKGSPAVTAEILPIMSPKTREHIKDYIRRDDIKKILAENAEIISDPKIVEGIENKFADFGKQLGAKAMDEYAGWSYEMMLDLAKTRPDGLAGMCFTFRNLLIKAGVFGEKEEVKEVTPAKKKSMFSKEAA